MQIYLLRHAETDYTKVSRIQGTSDVPLNAEGSIMAAKVGSHAKNLGVTHIYSATLKRARQTAEIVNRELGLEIDYDSRLNERDYGGWTHKLWSDVLKENPNLNRVWAQEGTAFKPPKGESIDDVVSRTLNFFEELIKHHGQNDRILIVSHGGPLKIILGYAKGLFKGDYYKQNLLNTCELIKIAYAGAFSLDEN
ncbi:MAG: histidine phosphatase family protein [Candidatus Woesearchaeota archaeon]